MYRLFFYIQGFAEEMRLIVDNFNELLIKTAVFHAFLRTCRDYKPLGH